MNRKFFFAYIIVAWLIKYVYYEIYTYNIISLRVPQRTALKNKKLIFTENMQYYTLRIIYVYVLFSGIIFKLEHVN